MAKKKQKLSTESSGTRVSVTPTPKFVTDIGELERQVVDDKVTEVAEGLYAMMETAKAETLAAWRDLIAALNNLAMPFDSGVDLREVDGADGGVTWVFSAKMHVEIKKSDLLKIYRDVAIADFLKTLNKGKE